MKDWKNQINRLCSKQEQCGICILNNYKRITTKTIRSKKLKSVENKGM